MNDSTKKNITYGGFAVAALAVASAAPSLRVGGGFDIWQAILASAGGLTGVIGLVLQFLKGTGGNDKTIKILQAIATLIDSGIIGEGTALIDAVKANGIPSALHVKAQWGDNPAKVLDYGTFTEPKK